MGCFLSCCLCFLNFLQSVCILWSSTKSQLQHHLAVVPSLWALHCQEESCCKPPATLRVQDLLGAEPGRGQPWKNGMCCPGRTAFPLSSQGCWHLTRMEMPECPTLFLHCSRAVGLRRQTASLKKEGRELGIEERGRVGPSHGEHMRRSTKDLGSNPDTTLS